MAWRPFQKDQNIKFVDKTKVNPSYLALPVDCKQVDPIMGTACPSSIPRSIEKKSKFLNRKTSN